MLLYGPEVFRRGRASRGKGRCMAEPARALRRRLDQGHVWALGVFIKTPAPLPLPSVCVYYCSTYYKAVREGGGDSVHHRVCVCVRLCIYQSIANSNTQYLSCCSNGGHEVRETTSRVLSGLVCPLRTSERGGQGDCVKEGGGGDPSASPAPNTGPATPCAPHPFRFFLEARRTHDDFRGRQGLDPLAMTRASANRSQTVHGTRPLREAFPIV